MTEKKTDSIFVDKEDLKVFQDIVLENQSWVETIREALLTGAKARQNLKTKVLLYWKKISPKYKLEKDLVYDINPETGEVTLSKNQPIKKEVKK